MKGRLDLPTWADVFRRISLDERDRKNMSFVFWDKPESVEKYVGRPEEIQLP